MYCLALIHYGLLFEQILNGKTWGSPEIVERESLFFSDFCPIPCWRPDEIVLTTQQKERDFRMKKIEEDEQKIRQREREQLQLLL